MRKAWMPFLETRNKFMLQLYVHCKHHMSHELSKYPLARISTTKRVHMFHIHAIIYWISWEVHHLGKIAIAWSFHVCSISKKSHRTECPDPCSNSAFHKRCLSCSKPLPCRIIAWITQNSLDWLQPISLLMSWGSLKKHCQVAGVQLGFVRDDVWEKQTLHFFRRYPWWCKDWAKKINTSYYVHGRNLANHLGSIQQTSPVNRGKTLP